MRWLALAVVGVALGLLGPARAEEAKKDEGGWVQLFDGKTLKGWKAHPKSPGKWRVEEGAIVGSGPVSHLFSERGDYQDFHYRVEAMINDKGNSGQYFRTAFGPGFPRGYEAQINSTHTDTIRTGSLYGIVNVRKTKVKPGEWFTQEVIARGNHIIIKVEGETTVDVVLDPKKKQPIYIKGHFAFQQHDPGSVIKVRKVEVKEFPVAKD